MPKKKLPAPYMPDKHNLSKPITVSQAVMLLYGLEDKHKTPAKDKDPTGSNGHVVSPEHLITKAKKRLRKAIKDNADLLELKNDQMPFNKLHAWACARYNVNRLVNIPKTELIEEKIQAGDDTETQIRINELAICNEMLNQQLKINDILLAKIKDLEEKLITKHRVSVERAAYGKKGGRPPKKV